MGFGSTVDLVKMEAEEDCGKWSVEQTVNLWCASLYVNL